MVLTVAKVVNNIIESIFITSELIENLQEILGEGTYVDVTGMDCHEGDTYMDGVVISNFATLPTSTKLSPTNVSALYLMLGSACNMSCRHCTQEPIKSFKCPNQKLKENVLEFIVDWDKRGGGRFYFWGGEPLLYWNTIKECIELFESKGMCNSIYRIFTNGLLLTDEIAEYCNAHNIWVIMSYDAPNPLVARNNVPSVENIKALLKCNKRTVNGVYNAINNNMVESFKYLESLFPDTEITLGFLNVLWKIPEDLYAFKEGEVQKAILDLFEYYKETHDSYVHRWFITKLLRHIPDFELEDFLENPYPPCAPGRCSLSFDFDGNIKRCHNDSITITDLSKEYSDIQDAHTQVWKDLLPENCKNCEYLSICRSICPIALLTEDKKEFVQCNYMREFWQAVLDCEKEFWEVEEVNDGTTYLDK